MNWECNCSVEGTTEMGPEGSGVVKYIFRATCSVKFAMVPIDEERNGREDDVSVAITQSGIG